MGSNYRLPDIWSILVILMTLSSWQTPSTVYAYDKPCYRDSFSCNLDPEIDDFFRANGIISYRQPKFQNFLTKLTESHPETPVYFQSPEVIGNDVEIVDTAERAYDLWTNLIQAAQKHIHIQTFFFVDDVAFKGDEPVPCPLAPDVLERNEMACQLWSAADRGVDIRLITDSVGNLNTLVGGEKIVNQLAQHPLIDVHYYNPLVAYQGIRESLWEPYRVWLWPQNRMHTKLMIVDGRSAITGGRNIGRSYLKPSPESPADVWGPRVYGNICDYKYRDTDIYVTGPGVAEIQRTFLKNWLEYSDWEQTITDQTDSWSLFNPHMWWSPKGCIQQTVYQLPLYCKKNDDRLQGLSSSEALSNDSEFFPNLVVSGTNTIRYVDSSPAHAGQIPDHPYLLYHPQSSYQFRTSMNRDDVLRFADPKVDQYRGLTTGEKIYIALIRNAKKRIRLTNPYFALNQPIRDALLEAMISRNVKVDVFTNSYQSNDEAILWDCSIKDFEVFLSHGADIYEWMSQAGMMHAKTAIFDNEIAIVGSFNFDNASFKSNTESLTVVRGKDVLAKISEVWRLDITNPMTRKMTFESLEDDKKARELITTLVKPICQKLGGLRYIRK